MNILGVTFDTKLRCTQFNLIKGAMAWAWLIGFGAYSTYNLHMYK